MTGEKAQLEGISGRRHTGQQRAWELEVLLVDVWVVGLGWGGSVRMDG
ncbi:hypothetical protein [Kribbella sp. NPDC049227]